MKASAQELTSGERRLQVRPYVQFGRISTGAGRDHRGQGAVEVHLLRLQSGTQKEEPSAYRPEQIWSHSFSFRVYGTVQSFVDAKTEVLDGELSPASFDLFPSKPEAKLDTA